MWLSRMDGLTGVWSFCVSEKPPEWPRSRSAAWASCDSKWDAEPALEPPHQGGRLRVTPGRGGGCTAAREPLGSLLVQAGGRPGFEAESISCQVICTVCALPPSFLPSCSFTLASDGQPGA